MTITQLQYFQAVCETGNMKTASELLHVSQPAISSSIRNLEEELHLNLVQRTPKGTVPTADGLVFLESVQDFLSRFQRLYHVAQDISSAHRKLRCGVSPMLGSCVFPYIYNNFHRKYPDIHVDMVTELGVYAMYEKLQKDQLDLLLVPALDLPEDLTGYVFRTERLLMCVDRSDPIVGKAERTLEDLHRLPLALLPPGYLQYKLVTELFRKQNLEPNVLLYTNQLSVICNFVDAGTAAGFLYESYVKNFCGDNVVALDVGMPTIPFTVVWKKEGHLFSAARKFLQEVKNSAGIAGSP